MNNQLSSQNFRQPLLTLTLFTIASIGFQFFLVTFKLPETLLFLLVAPIFWSVIHYRRWVGFSMLVILTANAVWVAHQVSESFINSLVTIAVIFTVSSFTMYWLVSLVMNNSQKTERYRIVADYVSQFEFWRKPDGTFAYVSPACEQITGYPAKKFMENPKFFHEIIHPADRPKLDIDNEKEIGKTVIIRFIHRNGDERYVEHNYQKVYSKEGAYLGVRASNRDITEQIKAEEKLNKTTERLTLALEGTKDGVWDIDLTTNQVILSSNYIDKLGLILTDPIGAPNSVALQDLHTLIHPKDAGSMMEAFGNHLSGKTSTYTSEYRIHTREDDWRWVLDRGKVTLRSPKGKALRMIGTFVDINERKEIEEALQQSEAALKESEERYRSLIEHQGSGVSIIDSDNVITYINPAGEDIFGVPIGTLSGRNLEEFVDEEQIAFLKNQNQNHRYGTENSYELTIKRPDQSTRSLLITATPRFNAEGNYIGVVATFRDITIRKRREDRLRYISLHDALTGIHNRTHFEHELSRFEENWELYPAGIIMIDVDDLKLANDRHGHATGDDLLVRVANVLKSSTRSGDVVARIGGDEFAILLPNTGSKTLHQAIKRIEQKVEQNNKDNSRLFKISLSIGGHTCLHASQLKESLKLADKQMYQAKRERKEQMQDREDARLS